MKKLLAAAALTASTLFPIVATAKPAAAAPATSPSGCQINYRAGFIFCYQIVGTGSYVDVFEGTLESLGGPRHLIVEVGGPGGWWATWANAPACGPPELWVINVWRSVTPGRYTATIAGGNPISWYVE